MLQAPKPDTSNLQAQQHSAADFWIAFSLLAATVLWSALAGKDLNWDQLNYHFYVSFSLLNDRLGHDFMPANAQSYLNPLAYVPFYWMVAHDWSSLLIASILAAFHSLNIVLAYLIARKTMLPHTGRALPAVGAVLAFLSPVFLTEAGTTFADVTTAVFLLAAVLCSLVSSADDRRLSWHLLLGGLLAGIAGGLKLSNLVFGPAFVVLLVVLYPTFSTALRASVTFGIGAAIGLVAAHGYWSWQLLHQFGGVSYLSPPFGSPDGAQSSNILPQRFLPGSLLEALLLPFRMIELRAWVYIETVAPDLRFAATVFAALGSVVLGLRGRRTGLDAASAHEPRSRRALLAFFLAALVLWIATSSNGRYGIMVSILCGPVLVLLVSRLSQRHSVVIATLVTLATLQCLHASNGQLRWVGEKWTRSWYDADIPERFANEPYLYLSLGGNSNSYIAPFLASQSAFANPIGQQSVERNGPGWAQLQMLIEKYHSRIRVLAMAPALQDEGSFDTWASRVDTAIARLGFALDRKDCAVLSTAGPRSLWTIQVSSKRDANRRYLRTCAVVARPYQHHAERDQVRKVVRTIVNWCPRLFGTPHGVVEETRGGWSVNYAATDTILLLYPDRILLTHIRSMTDLYLGTMQDWESGRKPDCAKMPKNFGKGP